MTTPTDTHGMLLKLHDRVFNSGPVRRTKSRRGMTGLSLLGPAKPPTGAQTATPQAIRSRLSAIVKRSPQVLVRVSGGGRNIRHIKAHLDYISRNGQIALEDQNGTMINGREEVGALRDEWQFGGFPISDASTARQAFNIVLSMPAGTDELAVLDAAKEFASTEFSNFQYAMALHTFDTDPDKDPSPNPHVHLCVKAVGLDGIRLNPRKDDLQRWREGFARCLRERGVDADATRRIHRLQRVRGEKQSVRYQKARGDQFHSIGKFPSGLERIAKAKKLASQVIGSYREIAKALASSDVASDRALALALARRVTQPDLFETPGLPRQVEPSKGRGEGGNDRGKE